MTTVCTCEASTQIVRIQCFEKATRAFYEQRKLTFPRLAFVRARTIADIRLDNRIEDLSIVQSIGESLVLQHFLETFSKTHPKFALETQSLKTHSQTRLFKDL